MTIFERFSTLCIGSFSPVTSPICPATTASQVNNCVDFETTTTAAPTPAGNAAVVDALADVGVDNSVKQLSVTLVWERNCDLDLHVYQPDGVQIAYFRKGPLSSTGRLDADSSSVGSNGLAVENVSWNTAPAGFYRVAVKNYNGCWPGVDYKLFVQIDGVTTVYERTAPGGDSTKYEVLSFVYGESFRSLSADVDFDISEIALPADAEEKMN